jgi:4-amino-4-deoxy-L-arabinose transferase-like glycosyltransferase
MRIIKKYWYEIAVCLIVLVALVLRFYNYDTRWVLAHDQARDALVAREALNQHKIPVLGPFSQAGTFVMGPIWYWLVAASTAIYPSSIFAPWIVVTMSFVAIVYLMILIGREMDGKLFGLMLGIIAAISSSQVAQSTNLTNPSGVAIFSALAVYCSIRYIKTGKNLFLFLFPFFIAIAANIHLQAIGLLAIVPVTLIVKRPNLKQLIYFILGFVIPFVPLMIFDFNNNFYDYRSMLDYYLYGQYRIYVPNRWLTYLSVYWPSSWGYIVGGTKEVGYLIISLLSLTVLYIGIFKKKISKPMLSIILSFLLILIMLRFFRGERFDGYILFAHPFIVILSGWTILSLMKLNKILGSILFGIILVGSMYVNVLTIKNSTNHSAIQVNEWVNKLTQEYPDRKFVIYDLKGEHKGLSLPLSLFLDVSGKISDNGMKIGLAVDPSGKLEYQSIFKDQEGYQFFNLNGVGPDKLKEEGWFNANPSAIYGETEEWFIGKEL